MIQSREKTLGNGYHRSLDTITVPFALQHRPSLMSAIQIRSLLRASVSLCCLLALAGCTATRETYTGQSAERVWTAMVAVANTPDYASSPDITERWTVRQNSVFVDEDQSRIEILRTLERYLHQPAQPVLHENQEWRFQIVMEQSDPPVVKFTSRSAGVPAHAWNEADRYFAQVWEVLGETPPAKPKRKEVELSPEQREGVQMYDG
jgi:hypothetical protein